MPNENFWPSPTWGYADPLLPKVDIFFLQKMRNILKRMHKQSSDDKKLPNLEWNKIIFFLIEKLFLYTFQNMTHLMGQKNWCLSMGSRHSLFRKSNIFFLFRCLREKNWIQKTNLFALFYNKKRCIYFSIAPIEILRMACVLWKLLVIWNVE